MNRGVKRVGNKEVERRKIKEMRQDWRGEKMTQEEMRG